MKSFFIWMQKNEGWKSILAIVYAIICVFDFVVVPVWLGLTRQEFDVVTNVLALKELDITAQLKVIELWTYSHNPFTLRGNGLFHIAFGALLTGSAVTRLRPDVPPPKV